MAVVISVGSFVPIYGILLLMSIVTCFILPLISAFLDSTLHKFMILLDIHLFNFCSNELPTTVSLHFILLKGTVASSASSRIHILCSAESFYFPLNDQDLFYSRMPEVSFWCNFYICCFWIVIHVQYACPSVFLICSVVCSCSRDSFLWINHFHNFLSIEMQSFYCFSPSTFSSRLYLLQIYPRFFLFRQENKHITSNDFYFCFLGYHHVHVLKLAK